jgi:hypothetical protein
VTFTLHRGAERDLGDAARFYRKSRCSIEAKSSRPVRCQPPCRAHREKSPLSAGFRYFVGCSGKTYWWYGCP